MYLCTRAICITMNQPQRYEQALKLEIEEKTNVTYKKFYKDAHQDVEQVAGI